MRRALAGMLAGSVVLAGCTQEFDDDVSRTSTPPLVVQTAAPDPTEATDDVAVTTAPDDVEASTMEPVIPVDPADGITDTELLRQVRWVLGLLEPGAEGPAAQDTAQRFAPSFLEQVSPVQLGAVFAQLRSGGPYVVTRAGQAEGVGRTASLALAADPQPLVMTLGLDDQGRIATLLFQPDTSGTPPTLSGWEDLDEALTELEGQAQVVVGRVDVPGGSCEVLHTTAGLEPEASPRRAGRSTSCWCSPPWWTRWRRGS